MTPNRKVAAGLASVVAFMLVMSFTAGPVYDWLGRVTGLAARPMTAEQANAQMLDRTIGVRLDASLGRDVPLQVRPVVRRMQLKIGETGLAFFEIYNPTDQVIAARTSSSVYPFTAAFYFNTPDCFCSEVQVLQPGERAMLPVSFYVDPGIVDNAETNSVKSFTLSYTFYVTDLPEDKVGLVESGNDT
jgi:cytochrome c oxidase assembly protein subunit 11